MATQGAARSHILLSPVRYPGLAETGNRSRKGSLRGETNGETSSWGKLDLENPAARVPLTGWGFDQ